MVTEEAITVARMEPPAAPPKPTADVQLGQEVAKYYADPLGFVRFAYPWGQGQLKNFGGPDKWQAEFLADLGRQVRARRFTGVAPVAPIRMAVASGHGVGKSTLVAWLVNWILSTRPDAQGTITANTFSQLQSKTWAAVQTWTARCITGRWFTTTVGGKIVNRKRPSSWFATAQTCREENSESFAGQHAVSSTSFYVFDEASAIPDVIWDVAEGGLTDGEPMIFAFGNPTRNSGKFHRITTGSERERWNQRAIDSRTCKITNKELIAQWIADNGEDSDFVRVRVRGLPPRASDAQFISQDAVYAAQQRTPMVLPDEPLIVGVDVSRGGSAATVMRFRRGLDARTIPPIRIPGEQCRDSMVVVTKLCEVLDTEYEGRKPAMCFVDATGGSIGGPIADRVRQLGHRNVVDVQFGGDSPDPKYANMRSYMWGEVRDWLARGGAIGKEPQLEADLTGPGYTHDKRDRLLLESKESMLKRDVASPDDGDALGLTFAARVSAVKKPPPKQQPWGSDGGAQGWMA